MTRKQWLRTCCNLMQLSWYAPNPAAREAFHRQYQRTKEKGEPRQR